MQYVRCYFRCFLYGVLFNPPLNPKRGLFFRKDSCQRNLSKVSHLIHSSRWIPIQSGCLLGLLSAMCSYKSSVLILGHLLCVTLQPISWPWWTWWIILLSHLFKKHSCESWNKILFYIKYTWPFWKVENYRMKYLFKTHSFVQSIFIDYLLHARYCEM